MFVYDYKTFKGFIVQSLDPNFIDCHDTYLDIPGYPDDFKNNRKEDGYLYTEDVREQLQNQHNEPVKYVINRNGFRSQHFQNFKPDDLNILFAGCSITHGTALPDEYVWRSILTEKVKTLHPDRNVEAYSVAIGGASIPLIFKNTLAFLRQYPEVDYVFILFPGFDRASMIDSDVYRGTPGFKKVNYVSPDENVFKIPNIKKHALNYVPENAMHVMLPMIKAIEDICALNGTKLAWGSWIPFDHGVYDAYDFKNYVKLPIWEHLNSPRSLGPDPSFKTVAKDGSHPGLDYQTIIADTFYGVMFNEE